MKKPQKGRTDYTEMLRRVEQARKAGKAMRVFDWNKAARIIAEVRPSGADAGLAEDWFWTAGTILEDGLPRSDGMGPFLSSIWATPTLRYTKDGTEVSIDCWLPASECDWNDATRWPDSAKTICGFPL